MRYARGIEQVYFKALGLITRTVGRVVPPDDVEDIVQETYVKACQVKNESDIRNPQAFLLKMARNLALDHIKRAEFRLASSMSGAAGETDYEPRSSGDLTHDTAAGDQEFALFCESIRQLPQQSRRAFVLKKVYGYSQKEIAIQLGVSESTVEKHIASGLLKSRQFMMKHASVAEFAKPSVRE
ncbi:RNA polymerase sigma factor [Gilvimarinus sp. SDUM040013]|uniref:RNA polymerase sigma factor n=1 Tax=Gilvimarinus gilvus TaxID=3058038 RepID=A0ABU4S1N7_9GAMM|nr:RNA polymerase sigma factor [Gilvimarinus sp. SDUM040013]MDO3386237.1 RNA polymerase sigma factor [Gilvimarinus sp. SDUM040013]MDX6849768.1 RNA polymerase sigma factor [Gilvimarinus sp. SDUM040013]